MNGFILGFQRFVWWPKWTPESNNSFTPMLITIFPLVKTTRIFAQHPAEHGIEFDVIMVRLRAASAQQAACTRCEMNRFSLPVIWRKGMVRIAEKREVAIGILAQIGLQYLS